MNGYQTLAGILQFDAQGLMPAIIQDAKTKQVLTLCYFNHEALERSLREGVVYVYRRSQKRLMRKGETSGHIQRIKEIRVDCEGKSLVLLVQQHVAACHSGYFTCYYRALSKSGGLETLGKQAFDPSKVYRR